MAKGFKAGSGGGTSLNFKVVGNPQPEAPSENTIWVNTDVPIGAWYFNATQPENLNEGDVWFSVGTSSPVEFNALKKNGIQVYPISAKQYVGGALVGVEAKSYQSGGWADWIIIFVDGAFLTENYGEWAHYNFGGTGGSATHDDNGVLLSANAGNSQNGAGAYYGPAEMVDFTNVNILYGTIENVSGSATAELGITDEQDTRYSSVWLAKASGKPSATSKLEVDVSQITGTHYLRVGCRIDINGAAAKLRFTKVWAE